MVKQVINIRDSVAIHDSVVVVRNKQGEVKERLVVRYRDRRHATESALSLQQQLDRYKASNDSLRAIRRDSISVPVPVEKQPTRWQQFKMSVGGWAIGALSTVVLAIVAYIIVWLVRKYR